MMIMKEAQTIGGVVMNSIWLLKILYSFYSILEHQFALSMPYLSHVILLIM